MTDPADARPPFGPAIPVLPAYDPIATAAFYVERLGFVQHHADQNYAVLARAGIEIHLWAAHDDGWRKRGAEPPVVSGAESFLAGTASCRVAVRDVDALYAELAPRDVVHPNGAIGDRPWGYREFAVLDLDGNLITFFRPRAPD